MEENSVIKRKQTLNRGRSKQDNQLQIHLQNSQQNQLKETFESGLHTDELEESYMSPNQNSLRKSQFQNMKQLSFRQNKN